MFRRRAVLAALCLAPLFSAQGLLQLQLQAQATTPAEQLEALSGEYTNSFEPDTPPSFYVQDGKLIYENERRVPVDLKPISNLYFSIPETQANLRFALDSDGHATSVVLTDGSDSSVYQRTGPAVHHTFHDYQRTEAMIPMRDGIKLHAVILKPADIAGPLPILMQRTPYGVDGTNRASIFAQRPDLARDGYIFVAEDIRGRYKSEGEFVMMRPLADHSPASKLDPKIVDESTDSYDTVAWLLTNVSGNNGRVGITGVSYPGFLTMMAGIDPHPAVKAISPQAPMIDVWMGDDFFHNGAFRQSYGYDYVMGLESTKEDTQVSYGKDKDGKPRDGFDLFSRARFVCSGCEKIRIEDAATWKLFLEHPAYDPSGLRERLRITSM